MDVLQSWSIILQYRLVNRRGLSNFLNWKVVSLKIQEITILDALDDILF